MERRDMKEKLFPGNAYSGKNMIIMSIERLQRKQRRDKTTVRWYQI